MKNSNIKELEELNRLEKELTKNLDNEIKNEEYIVNLIDIVTNNLLNDNRTSCEINSNNYMIAYRISDVIDKKSLLGHKKRIFLVCTDIEKYEKFEGRYKPYTATCDYNCAFDLKSNIKVVVEGLVRNITGTVKASMIPDKE